MGLQRLNSPRKSVMALSQSLEIESLSEISIIWHSPWPWGRKRPGEWDRVKVGLSVLCWVVIHPLLWRSLLGHCGRPCCYSCKATCMANTGAHCILALCKPSPLEPQFSKINKTLKSLCDFFFSLCSPQCREPSQTRTYWCTFPAGFHLCLVCFVLKNNKPFSCAVVFILSFSRACNQSLTESSASLTFLF